MKLNAKNPRQLLGLKAHQRLPENTKVGHVNKQAQKRNKPVVYIWTDGGCRRNGFKNSVGAWACLLQTQLDGEEYQKIWCDGEWGTTNNRMEMMACIVALRKLRNPTRVVIRIDSKYVKNGITKYIKTWQYNGWMTQAGTPVKNKDLWVELHSLIKKHTVVFIWVEGHKNDRNNLYVDQLCYLKMDELEAKAGMKKII
ncbi:ribonuclease H family protein (plasmid) [Paenibacillus sp. EC2-1]|uniref:ribonuclease H family protein n=1 Tax=Paenibacillus sp. EC2-1 TaxID=3388665 RepID=UPI003BEEDC43